MIYLDNAATTFPKPECVYEACDRFARTGAVNAGRGAYALARAATEMIKDVKRELISLLDAREQAEVVLTPSVTIALNQIILGQPWKPGMRAYISPYEHNAVSRPLELMRKKYGIEVRLLPLKEDFSIDLTETERQFQAAPPDFVCVTAVSNVTGYMLPAARIFRMAKACGAFTVLDAAQALGLLPLRFAPLFADCVAFAGHKTLYAPFGIAGFYIKNGCDLEEWITGGNGIRSEVLSLPAYMPEKMESASMDTVAIAGLQTALNWRKSYRRETGEEPLSHEQALMARLVPELLKIPGVTVYAAPGNEDGTHPELQAGLVSFNLEGFRANEVGALLDFTSGIAVRAGHHCAAYIHKYLKNARYDGTIRVSTSVFNTEEDIDALLRALKSIDREALKGIDAQILRGNC